MIIGLFVKHYKIYNGIKFIPISNSELFSAYIGPNGAGKSSILEALDSFFNNRKWNINKQAKAKGGIVYINTPYIVPVFFIKKSELPNTTASEKKSYNLINKLSDYFWSIKRKEVSSSSSETTAFLKFRDFLKEKYDQENYFLFILGKRYEQQNRNYFGTFHHSKSLLTVFGYENKETRELEREKAYPIEDDFIQKKTNGLFEYIDSIYSYIYIPSDIDVADYTKIETLDMQKLMNKDIQNEIKNAIKQKNLNEINKSLNLFLDEITEKLEIYSYKKPRGGKAKITMPDLITIIIESFFSIRVLSKEVAGNYIAVNDLSSGEKRKALIDLAHAFLQNEDSHDKKIILAIDEPEMSLHVSACFDQFEKIKEITTHGHQVLLTTHWYGFLPIVSKGIAHSTFKKDDDKVYFESYDLKNYRESIISQKRKKKGKMPYDIYLKSSNDLVQSIVSSIREENEYKWILCEGSSEQIYFNKLLEREIKENKYRILPLGGCGEIVRLFEYLEVSMNDKDLKLKGKVLAIVDTDEVHMSFKPKSGVKNLFFRRLLFKDNDIHLVKVDDVLVSPVTEIEDALEPNAYIETLKKIGTEEIVEIISDEENINKNARCSFNCLDLREADKEKIKAFFNGPGNKTLFAREYINMETSDEIKLLSEIKEILQ